MNQKENIEITEIFPIDRKIGKKEALNATRTTKNEANFIGDGSSGAVYRFREKYAVKKYIKNFEREIKILQNLKISVDEGLDIGNSQKGIAAFKTNEQNVQEYLVSTFVSGKKIFDFSDKILSVKRFSDILNRILNFDLHIIEKENLNLRYTYLLHDISMSNILFSENEVNFLDFEYLKKEFIDLYFSKRFSFESHNLATNILDDSMHLPSNLRIFENSFIWLYIIFLYNEHNFEKDTIITAFDNYLKAKSQFLLKLHHAHLKQIQTRTYGKVTLKEMADFELIESNLLISNNNNIPKDIRQAEIYKIQLSNFYYQLFVMGTGTVFKNNKTFKTKQIIDYRKKVIDYFEKCIVSAKETNDNNRLLYFEKAKLFSEKFTPLDENSFEKEKQLEQDVLILDEILL